jgi:EmrB/QacA subfamily drug resistance transporter
MNRDQITEKQASFKWWVFAAVGIGTFMSAIDSSVVNTILPVLRQYFNTSVSTMEWTVVIYLLVVSSLLLAFGRLGDLSGHKRYFLVGFIVFILGSALCGFAPTQIFLILARAFQAIGSAMLLANSPAILTATFPASQRGRALGLQATMTYLGLSIGPAFGGWLTKALGWRSVFYINVPIALLAFIISWRFIRSDNQPRVAGQRFDWKGAILFSAGLSALLLGLNNGAEWGWGSLLVLVCLGIAILLLAVFIWVESRTFQPMLDLGLFKIRLFSASTASAVLNYICLYSVIFLMPFYLIQGRGLDSAQAGLLLTALPILMAISAPISGALSDKIDSRFLSTSGMVLIGVGLFLLSRLTGSSSNIQILLSLALTGLGTGIFISPNTSALMGSAPRDRQGIASGILATARNVGMVLGIGMAGAIFTSLMANNSGNMFFAISIAFLSAMGVAGVGAVISTIRGK